MDGINVEKLEDIAPHVVEHLLPEIQDAVEVCVSAYEADPFNDSWTFGTHLWKNIWNRFKSLTNHEDCPFDLYGKGNEYKLKIGPFILRHHKIDNESSVPTGAKAVKASAAVQLSLFSILGDIPVGLRPSIDNIVIAIVANTQNGLREVFVGELLPCAPDSTKYKWVNKAPVYLAEGQEGSTSETVYISTPFVSPHAPVEPISEPTLKLVKTNKEQKIANSYSE